MPRPIHFELCTKNLDGLTTFYKDALGWDFNTWRPEIPYRIATTGDDAAPGINGAAMPEFDGFTGVVLTMASDDVDKSVARVVEAGGSIVKERHAVPGVGWQAYVKDPDGNVFGLHRADKSAGT